MATDKQKFWLAATLTSTLASTLALGLVGGASLAQAQEADARPETEAKAQVDPEMLKALESRVKSLEQQMIDLRTMIGASASLRQSASGRRDPQQMGPQPMGALPTGTMSGQDMSSMGPRPYASSGPPPAPEGGMSWPRDGQASGGSETDNLPENHEPPADEGQETARVEAAPPPANSPGAHALYKDAYSHMLRRDYASAQKAFSALLQSHPQSKMAGSARYWLGETYYVRGKYQPAANAFLKAYKDYPDSAKAPDSLMKLALSLVRLGQKGAACKTFSQLEVKYPNAPGHVKQRANMERRRAGCN